MLHWFQSTDISHAPLISVMLHWLQSCSTDFRHAPLISVMLHWLQSCSTDFSHAPLTSVMLQWFQSCSTDFSPLKSVEHDWNQWSMTEFSGAWLKSVDWNQWSIIRSDALFFYFWKFSMFIWVKFIEKQQKYLKKEDCEFCAWASHFIMNYKITIKYIRISSCTQILLMIAFDQRMFCDWLHTKLQTNLYIYTLPHKYKCAIQLQ